MTTPRLRTALVRESELPASPTAPTTARPPLRPGPEASFARPALLPDPDIHAVTGAGVSSAERGAQVRLGVTLFSSRAAPRLPTAKTRSHPRRPCGVDDGPGSGSGRPAGDVLPVRHRGRTTRFGCGHATRAPPWVGPSRFSPAPASC